ncbi:hypothetical protein M0R04_15955, partial [Candidatus Dojkabacteria bacterium]|nr:hypothetical protein [Candidatus Dojkabacteria bacterium]
NKDNTNITYGGAGNDTTVIKDAGPQMLLVKVYDKDKGSFNVTNPSATVTFKLIHTGYAGNEKVLGSNVTNSSGDAEFSLNFTECTGWQEGLQNWTASINSTESNYNVSTSINYSITLQKPGCTATVDVYAIDVPAQVFQYRNFSVNSTLTSWQDNAQSVSATVNSSQADWIFNDQTQFIGTVVVGTYPSVLWSVNATTSGSYNVNVYANSTNAQNDTMNSNSFVVYRQLARADSTEVLPISISANNETILSWSCNASNYRVAGLNLTLNSSSGTTIRIYTDTGLVWKDILHNYKLQTSPTFNSTIVPILQNQIFPNKTDSCRIKIKNIGLNNITIINASLGGYYEEDVRIQDISAEYNGIETTGIETSEILFNTSIKLGNFLTANYTVDVMLNITNSSNDMVYNYTNLNVVVPGNSTITSNFTSINTTNWAQGNYKLRASISGSQEDSRVEDFVFKNVTMTLRAGSNYMCNGTSEWFNVTFNHPFNDSISYNISLEVPSGWTYSGSRILNVTNQGNYTVGFNITSGQTNLTAYINATLNYSYFGVNKLKRNNKSIENNQSVPILEIIRETPKIIGKDVVFDAQLSVHNKGCAPTSTDTIVKEIISSGWTPANPSSLGEVALQGTSTDLINNVITWELSTIGVNKYAVLTYQVKSSTSASQSGNLRHNATYNSRSIVEESEFNVQTFNYTGESHLQFDLEAVQQGAFPWGETRSAQISKNYNYSLEVKNIGDINATGWNVTLRIPIDCNVSYPYSDGVWNETLRLVVWNLTELEVYGTKELNFTLNCTTEGKHVLVAKGIKNTTLENYTFSNVAIGCVGTDCSTTSNYNFSKPVGARYERLSEVDFNIGYNWTAANITIGNGMINLSDDSNNQRIIWQNYSYSNVQGNTWINYSLDVNNQKAFINESRNIRLNSYAAGTNGPTGNVTINNLAYTWESGKVFEEEENLFVKIKTYEYNPLLGTPYLFINHTEKTTGGWGEFYNFNISFRDRFARSVNITGWHKKTGDYDAVDSFICTNCGDSTEANFNYTYNGTDKGSWTFKFNTTNPDGGNESSLLTYTIESDDINADYSSPANNATVNRSLKTNFTMVIFDKDNASSPGYLVEGSLDAEKGKIYFAKFGTNNTWDTATGLNANSTGAISRQMENSGSQWCKADYPLGQGWWYGGVTGASTYKENLSSGRLMPFMLIGTLYAGYFSPNTTNYTVGSPIALQAYVKDDCDTNLTDTTLEFNLSTVGYSTTQIARTAGSDTYQNLTYTLPSAAPLGWYNVTIISNKTNYWNGTFTQGNAFYYGTAINLSYQNMTPYTSTFYGGGWGESPFRFNVTVNNNQSTAMYLWLWNSTNGWNYEYNENCTAPNCINYTVSRQKNFTCGNIGNWAFKYNSTDDTAFANNSLGNFSFIVERDDALVQLFEGNNSQVNRSESRTGTSTRLSTRINDTDYRNFTTNVNNLTSLFTYIYNGTGWETIDESTNSSEDVGGMNYYVDFNPGCNYLPGSRNWNMTIAGATCQKNISSINFNVNVIGDLNGNVTTPNGLQNYTKGNNVALSAYVKDDCNLDMSSLTTAYFNLTNGTYTQTCPVTSNDGSGVYSCTWTSAGNATGWYNVTFYSGMANYNSNDTTKSFFLSSTQTLTSPSVNPTSGGWGIANYTYSITVSKDDADTVNVSFWLRNATDNGDWLFTDSNTCTNCLNTVIKFNHSYVQEDIKNWSFKFNASDLHNNYAETYGGSHVITKDTITANLYEGNNSQVNRSESNPGNSVRLAAYLYDSDKLANTTNVTPTKLQFYITNRSNNWIEQSESVNDTGLNYYVDFNPTCNYNASQQNWNITVRNDTYHKNTSSVNFNVDIIGNLNGTYISPTGLTIYERGTNIVFSGNVTDDCGSLVSGATVQYEINSSTSTYYCNQTVGYNLVWSELAGVYNCTWDSNGKNISDYNVTMIISKAYHNSISDTEEDAFHIKATTALTGASVTPREQGWAINKTFSVNVSDNAGDNVTVWFYEAEFGTTNWNQIGTTKSCNETCSNYTLSWNNSYLCPDIGRKIFKFNATDLEGNLYATSGTDYMSSNNTYVVDADNVIIEYVQGNETNTTVDQNPTTLTLRVYDTDRATYNLDPAAYISYNVTMQGNSGVYYTLNTNTTNSTGQVDFVFYANTTFSREKQKWIGYINTGSSSCYLYNVSNAFNVTTLSNQPVLSAEFVTPIVGGWGDTRRFNVSVYDQNNTASVSFYKSETSSGPWTLVSTQDYSIPGSPVNLSFTHQASCSDLGTNGINKIWYFKFNSSNVVGNIYSTTIPKVANNYTLTRDYISFENIFGNNTIANRTGSQTDPLSLRVRDLNGSIVNGLNLTFKVTKSPGDWDTGTINITNSTGDVEYSFNPGCSPRYEVGAQNWQAIVSSDLCYQDNSTGYSNLTTWGEITLTLSRPTGTTNFTQEEAINFLGSSVDDCGSALTLNVSSGEIAFYAFNGTINFNCNSTAPVSSIGANAYSCDWVTALNTSSNWYNTSMNASKSYYYNSSTTKEEEPGLFYLLVKRRLDSPLAVPTSGGWGYPNWNFSFVASSGDPTISENLTLHIGTGWPPGAAEKCNETTCYNGTSTICIGCQNALTWWQRNFTYEDRGTIYYRFKVGDTYEDTIKSIILNKDNTNITYGGAGNDTTVIKDAGPQMLLVKVYDKDKGSFNVT